MLGLACEDFARESVTLAVYAERGVVFKVQGDVFHGEETDVLARIILAGAQKEDAKEGEKHLDPAPQIILLRGFDRDELQFVGIVPMQTIETESEATFGIGDHKQGVGARFGERLAGDIRTDPVHVITHQKIRSGRFGHGQVHSRSRRYVFRGKRG